MNDINMFVIRISALALSKSIYHSLDMLMRKQMILTILIISIALGTESELQVRIGLLRSAADCTLMSGDTLGSHP